MDKEVLAQLKDDIAKVETHFQEELKKLRTGRAHPSMVEDVMVEAYSTQMPLKQLATVTTPEPQLIQISAFDPGTVESIATSIRNNQSLGFNPTDDGAIVRIQVPPLTEERRSLIVKQLSEKQEDAMIGLRKARHDAISVIDAAKKNKEIGEDEAKRQHGQVDDAINAAKKSVEESAKQKQNEIMTV